MSFKIFNKGTTMNGNIENIRDKAVDWWGKHNITTRTVVLTILFLLVGTVMLAWLGKDIKYFSEILHTLSDTLTWMTIIIIAGVNGASAILDKIIQWKKG